MGKGAEGSGGGQFGNREIGSGVFRHAAKNISGVFAQRTLTRAQAGVGLGMADGEQFEFEREQSETAVGGGVRIVCTESAQTRGGIGVALQDGIYFGDAAADPVLEEREEDIFLTFEMSVERAAGVAGQGGDIGQARGFEPIARKDLFRGRQKLAAGGRGAHFLPGSDSRNARAATIRSRFG